ncbi:MAG TPA: hypothetical protein VGO00_08040 [Kofleriaceae bacterium]|jgi:hypothetical protein|nr:hypothetical protein [Kofleriaceae bacterium]
MKRRLVIAGIVVAALATMALRVVVDGRSALLDGDEALAKGNATDAIASWEAAARWYLPFAPHVDDAYERLTTLATKARAAKDPLTAIVAYRAIRSAAIATRSAWTPHAADLETANAAIAELAAVDPDGAPAAGVGVPARLGFYRERLATDARPTTAAAIIAGLGIALWLVGIAYLVRRGTDDAGHLARRPALVGAAITLGGLLCWAVGLVAA